MTNTYAMPEPRGAEREREITQAILTDTDPRHHADVIHDESVHTHLDPSRPTLDHTADQYVEPSYATATVSARKVKRTKRGQSVTVTSRGRVLVVGDSTAMDDGHFNRVPRVVAQHAIDQLRSGNRFGHADGDRLARLTDHLYGDAIPALIGTDHYDWAQATQEIPMDAHALHALIVTTVGLSGGHCAVLDRETAPRGHGRHNGTLTAYKRKGRTFPTRRRVGSLTPRKADDQGRRSITIVAEPYGTHDHASRDTHTAYGYVSGVWHTTELRGATGEPDTHYIGKRKVRQGMTVHGKRKPRTAIVETFTIENVSELATIAASLVGIGAARYAWEMGATAGTLTIDKRKRVSVIGDGVEIRQVTSLKTLRKRLAAT